MNGGIARPTLACLKVLLTDVLESVERKRFTVANLATLPPLDTIDHPLTKHCATQFDNRANAGHERIKSAVTVVAFKAKSGPWRAAVYIDDEGQPWIIDVGRRHDDDPSDFYRLFAAKDHQSLLPTADDLRQLKLERATRLLEAWERSVRSTAVTAVAAACKAPDNKCKLPVQDPKGALAGHLTVEVERLAADTADAHEYPAGIIVSIDLGGWANGPLSRAAMREVARVVAPSEDSWDAEPQSDGTMRHVATVTEVRLRQIEAASEVDDSHAIVATPPVIAPTSNAHYVGKSTIVDAVVNGDAVRGLCGRWFVPKHDPGDLPICLTCEAERERRSPTG